MSAQLALREDRCVTHTRLADLYAGSKLKRVRAKLERELARLLKASTPYLMIGSQAAPVSNSPPPKDLDLVEAVFCHREADGVAITYVQGARTANLWLPRHRAARLIAEIASALT